MAADKDLEAPGFAAFLIAIRLLQRLVMRGVLSIDDARELVDAALMDAEGLLTDSRSGDVVRQLLQQFLRDIERSRKGPGRAPDA